MNRLPVRDLRLRAHRDVRDVILRHVDVDTQFPRLRHHEQRRTAAGASVDQRADIGGACGDKPIERGEDALILFEHAQAVEIGLRAARTKPCLLEASAAR